MKKNTQKKLLVGAIIIIAIILIANLGVMLSNYLNSDIFIKVKFSETLNKIVAQNILSSYNIELNPGFILPFSGESVEESDEAIIKIDRYIYFIKSNRLRQEDRIIDISEVNISDYMPHLMPF